MKVMGDVILELFDVGEPLGGIGVQGFLEEDGFTVISAEDGLEAWNLLEENLNDISVVLTDLEMPNMNGFELTKKIKTTPDYSHLPVIALTSLAGEADIKRGKQVGIDKILATMVNEMLVMHTGRTGRLTVEAGETTV